MRAVFRVGATIVAILATLAAAGCGQRGALYLPTVPPLPQPPASAVSTAAPPGAAASDAGATDSSPATPGIPEQDTVPSVPMGPQNNGGLTPLPLTGQPR